MQTVVDVAVAVLVVNIENVIMMSAHTVCSLLQVSVHRDFSAVRDEAMKMIQSAFTLLDQEFQKLDRYMYMFVYLCSQELT